MTAKDMILHLISPRTAPTVPGLRVEFTGQAVAELDMEGRMTLCNMAVEFSAFTGLIAPDEKPSRFCAVGPTLPPGRYGSRRRTTGGRCGPRRTPAMTASW